MNEMVLYTKTTCPVCGMVRQFLDNMDVNYQEVNIDFHPLVMMKLVLKTRRLSVPQLVINGNWIFGYDPVRTMEVLNETDYWEKEGISK